MVSTAVLERFFQSAVTGADALDQQPVVGRELQDTGGMSTPKSP